MPQSFVRQLAPCAFSLPTLDLWQGPAMKRFSVVALTCVLSTSAVACSKKEKSESATTTGTAKQTAKTETMGTPSEIKPPEAVKPMETKVVEAATPTEVKPTEVKPTEVKSTEADKTATSAKVTHLDAKASQKVLAERKPIVLDIRTPKEFAEGHIKGALNIDFYAKDFAEKLAELDTSKEYLLHCRSGGRSGRSLPTFDKLGFEKILHLDGGMNAWVEAGLPTQQ